MLRFLLFILLFSPSLLFGQKSTYRAKIKDALFFWDDKLQKFVIIDDSVSIHVYNDATKNWDSEPLLLSSDVTFNNLISDFIPVSRDHKSTLFVHSGGGIVLELKGNIIERIDHSFAHKNQYFGTFFSYKNEPYIFGGYGLFSFKDFITRFDYNEKEWFKLTIDNLKPKPRRSCTSFLLDNSLYIIGGIGERNEKRAALKDNWEYNFTKSKWQQLGKINEKIPTHFNTDLRSPISLSNEYQPYFTTPDRIYSFDLKKNEVKVYKPSVLARYTVILKKQHHLLIKKVYDNNLDFEVVNEAMFLSNMSFGSTYLFSKTAEIGQPRTIWLYISILAVLFITLFIIGYIIIRKRKVDQLKFESSLDLNEKENELYRLFIKKMQFGVSTNEINDIIQFGNPSIETLKKRRENLIKSFKLKISILYKIRPEDVLIETKNNEDKRLKIIYLNKKILNIIMRDKKGEN